MIIYITDRNLNILTHASTTLPGGFRISNDKTVEEIESGVNTFSCEISYTDDTRRDLEDAVKVGRYILKQRGRGFTDKENIYDSLYQIIETEFDTKSQIMSIYAEDAGLDLLNKVCEGTTLTNKTISQMMAAFMPSDWTLNLIDAPSTTKTYTWDGESTCTERLMSVAGIFDCEIYYSFVIERFEVSAKVINVTKRRGVQTATEQLRLGRDIDRIMTKASIADLATAYTVKGGTPSGSDTPINLKNYPYSYTDPDTGDVYSVDSLTGQMRNTTAMKRWSSILDTDGLIVKSFSFETTDKATLAGQARAALQKASKEYINYEIDFADLPDDIEIGDRINIIDEDGELYLEARLLRLESSAADMTQVATVGEFLIRDSGISEKVIQLAAQFADYANRAIYTIDITSSAGDVFIETTVATTLTAHVFLDGRELSAEEVAQAGVVRWYDHDDLSTVLGTGLTYTITEASEVDAVSMTARLEED